MRTITNTLVSKSMKWPLDEKYVTADWRGDCEQYILPIAILIMYKCVFQVILGNFRKSGAHFSLKMGPKFGPQTKVGKLMTWLNVLNNFCEVSTWKILPLAEQNAKLNLITWISRYQQSHVDISIVVSLLNILLKAESLWMI